MDFEELMKLIANDEKMGEEAITIISERIKKPNNEAKNLRIRLKKAESELKKDNPVLQILKDNGLEINEESNVNEEATTFITALIDSKNLDNKKFDITKTTEYIKQQKQIDKLEKKSENDEQEKTKLKSKSTKREIENKLLAPFSESISNGGKVLNLLINSEKNPFVIDDDTNEIGFKLLDGDIITGTKEILEEYKKLNPNEIKNKSKSGNNTKQGDNFDIPNKFTSIDQIKSLSVKQIQNLSEDQNKQMNKILSTN